MASWSCTALVYLSNFRAGRNRVQCRPHTVRGAWSPPPPLALSICHLTRMHCSHRHTTFIYACMHTHTFLCTYRHKHNNISQYTALQYQITHNYMFTIEHYVKHRNKLVLNSDISEVSVYHLCYKCDSTRTCIHVHIPLQDSFLSCCAIMGTFYLCCRFRRKPYEKLTQFSAAWSLVSEIWSYPHLLPWLRYCNDALRWAHSSIIHRMQDFHSLSSRQLDETI